MVYTYINVDLHDDGVGAIVSRAIASVATASMAIVSRCLHDDGVGAVLCVAPEGGRHAVVAVVVDAFDLTAARDPEDTLGHVLLVRVRVRVRVRARVRLRAGVRVSASRT